MIYLSELTGGTPAEADVIELAVRGAVFLKGRTITPSVARLARECGRAWARSKPQELAALFIRLGLAPDDVLPRDDVQLARVIEAGRRAAA
jgi:hypothetical protein